MKTKFVLFAAILLFIIQGQSCFQGKQHGPLVKETRNVDNFDELEVSHGIDVYLTMGNDERLELETPEGLLKELITEVEGGTLKIYFDKSFNWNSETTIYLEAKKLRKIHASGGSDVKGENVVEAKNLDLAASGGSDLHLKVDVRDLEVKVSGGADVVLVGSAEYLEAETSGGSDLKAFDLVVQVADLEASGGSDIKVTVEEEIDATTSGGADIEYMGNPQKVNTDSSASSDIRKRN